MIDYTRQGICKQNSNHYTIKEAFEHPDILSVLLLIFFYYYILHEKKTEFIKRKSSFCHIIGEISVSVHLLAML